MTIQLQKRDFTSVGPIRPTHLNSTIIVVPCYNEEHRLNADAFLTYIDQTTGVSFLFVDDGSTDKTAARLKDLCEHRPDRLSAISLSANAGKAEAVRQGLLHATSSGASLVGYWDADLATPLDAIDDFLRIAHKLTDVSVIFGSRKMMLGHRIKRTLFRRSVSQVCSTLAHQALRLRIGDTQCGAKMFRNSYALKTSLKEPFSTGWLFDVELFSRLSKRIGDTQNAFFEHPLLEWDEVAGSKVSSKAIMEAGISMIRLIAENRLGLKLTRPRAVKTPTASVISVASNPLDNLAA